MTAKPGFAELARVHREVEPSILRIAHFNTNETAGGAAKAALRLHRALADQGVDSRLVVLNRDGSNINVKRVGDTSAHTEASLLLRDAAHKAAQYLTKPNDSFDFDLSLFSAPTAALMRDVGSADVLNVHWVRGLVSSSQLRAMTRELRKPIVWTLMDLEPMTGGCHYPGDCKGYELECGSCPVLRSNSTHDASRRTWNRRRRNYSEIPLTIVAPTSWVADHARRSSLMSSLRCELIPLSVDTDLFRPGRQRLAREVLSIPQTALVLFCGAQQLRQKRKGLNELVGALNRLQSRLKVEHPETAQRVLVVTAGPYDPAPDLEGIFPQKHLGMLGDDRILALAHQAADIFVSPSLEDAGPLMLNEALACGVPAVAFTTGGALEWLKQAHGGYAARVGDIDDLALGIERFACDSELRANAGSAGRLLAEKDFTPSAVASKYLALYESLLL